MVKYSLHEMGFSAEEKFPRQSGITALWVILTLILTAGTILGVNGILRKDGFELELSKAPKLLIISIIEDFGIQGYFIFFILLFFIYFTLKLIMTLILCSDKNHSTCLKILESKALPVCACREAFKVWQIVIMYCIPVAVIYAPIFSLCIWSEANPGVMIILLFLAFFMAFDLTLVIFVLYIKAKYKIDYISVDYHVYGFTLYHRPYIRINKKSGKLK